MQSGESFQSVLTAAQDNAPSAFEQLYRRLAPAVLGYLRLQGATEPEDLTSEVFLAAFSRIGSFQGDESQCRAWIFTIAHHRLVDERRRSARRPKPAPEGLRVEARPAGDVEDDALRRLSEERVKDLCRHLAPAQRDVLLLRLVAGMTVSQVAEALDRTAGAVKALQRRGLAALRARLQAEGVPL